MIGYDEQLTPQMCLKTLYSQKVVWDGATQLEQAKVVLPLAYFLDAAIINSLVESLLVGNVLVTGKPACQQDANPAIRSHYKLVSRVMRTRLNQ